MKNKINSNVTLFYTSQLLLFGLQSLYHHRGALAVSALTSKSSVRVAATPGDIMLCSWTRRFGLTSPLSTQVY